MNNLIVLAAVTVALYGKAQCCCNNTKYNASEIQKYCCSTYDACAIQLQALQYDDSITCSSSPAAKLNATISFISASHLLTNELEPILSNTINNNSTFLVNPDVSFVVICI